MSSEPRTAVPRGLRRDPALEARFAARLKVDLPPDLQSLVPFFADLSRLETLAALLDRHLDAGPAGPATDVLDLGCGPFATELFVACLVGRRVTSVDYTPAFAAIGRAFQAAGMLEGVTIVEGDAMKFDPPPGAFDAIIIHDLLYEAALDMKALLTRLAPALRSGGLVYLDVMDARVRWLWRLLGRERGYRRYTPSEIEQALAAAGLSEIERRPLRQRAGLARAGLHVLLRAAGLSNAIAVVARKAV